MKTPKLLFRKSIIVFIAGLFVVILTNCTGKKGEPVESSEAKLDKDAVKQTVRDVVYPLPTSYEVIHMINKIEASYIIGITNPLENVDKYFTDKDQALNLGIYSADLSYASTYNMKQEVMNFMDASQELIIQLDITGAFNKDFVDKVEANIDNKDTLVNLITNSFYDTYNYLVKNSKEDLSLLVLAGSWVEAMYISCNISETVYNNPELVSVIMHQKTALNKLIELLVPHNSHETIQSILNDLNPIKTIYDSIDEKGITEKQLEQIISQTEALRTRIIS
ncbi:MAG: hypothetical protein A2X13_05885 [Bacteroidetes bacterium GWC2_33_15]|nr:MAG: hypothetical protein A2X10_00570 [Bacteroidetes bacterium GWA2_33_15]OFX52019.1 MAG: hypothetical protein A2X13_05885 [Bacteroidetes bacterium GWC2_33_15]OFX63849.1 MAG: hypothetical protein A2X15_00810 [Bacteroidetes bacterium GWB2_32_14]OFX67422.1 MAG: hypothetical protein A2X14_12615 [Bacteroidetes bacterium GWD2_33_33]HAN17812.1 hypothetical protein [Bacteroidales bacterium]